jgi:hypothetical protein
MLAAARTFELRLIFVFLALVAVFVLWVIPVSIEDPEGFGYYQGLAPSFSVYLVAAMAALTLIVRLFRVLLLGENEGDASAPESEAEETSKFHLRSGLIIGACLIFAFLGIQFFGFYLSSFVFVIVLAFLMGEQRPMVLGSVALVLVAGIFAAFELGFTILLPRGELTQPLLDAFGG